MPHVRLVGTHVARRGGVGRRLAGVAARAAISREDVEWTNGEVKLAGTLYLPEGVGRIRPWSFCTVRETCRETSCYFASTASSWPTMAWRYRHAQRPGVDAIVRLQITSSEWLDHSAAAGRPPSPRRGPRCGDSLRRSIRPGASCGALRDPTPGRAPRQRRELAGSPCGRPSDDARVRALTTGSLSRRVGDPAPGNRWPSCHPVETVRISEEGEQQLRDALPGVEIKALMPGCRWRHRGFVQQPPILAVCPRMSRTKCM